MKSARRRLPRRPKVCLFFAESRNDSGALVHLVQALRRDVPDCRIVNEPLILSAEAAREKKLELSSRIKSVVDALSIRAEVVGVIVHRDCDQVEPAHLVNAEELERLLAADGIPQPIAATPAYEIETWWFLWPQIASSIRNCWRELPSRNRNHGLVENAKEKLRTELRPTGRTHRCPDYAESDSVAIAKQVRDGGSVNTVVGSSESFSCFRHKVLQADF
jgi:hypothetical protein